MATSNPPRLSRLIAHDYCSVDRGVTYEQFREAVLSPNGRFIFYPADFYSFDFVDLLHAKICELRLPQQEMVQIKRLRLFPIDDHSVLLLGKPAKSITRYFYDYNMAIYELPRPEDNSSIRPKPLQWKHVAHLSKYHTRSFFQVGRRLYFLCTSRLRRNQLHYFDLERNGKFVKDWAEFQTTVGDDVNRRKIKDYTAFQTLYDSHLYSFKRMSRLGNFVRRIQRLYDHYSRICRQNIKTGKLDFVYLNDLRCLRIPECSYDLRSTFSLQGQWRSHRFYLHLTVRKPTAETCQVHYFAYLDLFTLEWMPITVELQPYHIQCPIQMAMTDDQIMVLMQFHSTPKLFVDGKLVKRGHMCKEGASLCKVCIYRIPMREPESLKHLSQLAFNRLLNEKSPDDRWKTVQQLRGVMVRPVYYA